MSSSANGSSTNSVVTPVAALLGVAVFVAGAAIFAAHQSVWVDETTQLTGLALPLGRQMLWLTGQLDLSLGAPEDRTPPLSYLLGSAWAALFGLGEASMRGFGIAMAALAAPALYRAGALVGGRRLAGLAALWLTLATPAMMSMGGEIRAYPLFFALSAWAALPYAALIADPDPAAEARRLALMALALVAAAYAHFFGVVAAGAMFGALLMNRLILGWGARGVIVAGLAAAAAMAGLAPFILHAIEMSAGVPEPAGPVAPVEALRAAARLGFHLVAHPSMLAAPWALWLSLAGAAALAFLFVASAAAGGGGRRGGWARLVGLAGPLALAFVLLIAAKFLTGAFETLAPHYNIWMTPLVGLVLAAALAAPGGLRPFAAGAAALSVLGQLGGASALLRHAELYSHGPGEAVFAALADPAESLVIHDHRDPWGMLYFPLRHLGGGATTQWLRGADGQLQALTDDGLSPVPDGAARPAAVYQLRSWRADSEALARIARGEAACAPPAGIGPAPGASLVFCAYVGAALTPIR